MLDQIVDYLREIPGQLAALLTFDAAIQIAVFLLLFPLARLLQRYARPPLQRLQQRAQHVSLLQQLAWLDDLFTTLQAIVQPLAAWVLGRAAVATLESAGVETALLAWLVPFLAVWLIYRLVTTWLQGRMPEEQFTTWRQRILRPLTWLTALLHATGFLDDVLRAGFTLSDSTITLQATLLGILVLALFLSLARTTRQLLGQDVLPRIGMETSLTQILATFVGYAIIVLGVSTALNVVGISLTTLTVIAGGLSVGIGFGMQEVISNFISGFILLFERSVGPGDVVEVEGVVGVVANVGIRAMRIKNLDNVELIVPNSNFLTNVVTNYTRGDSRIRVHVAVGASYDADPRAVEQALLESVNHARVLADPPPSVHFVNFGDNSLDFELLVWTDDAAAIPGLRSDLRFAIWQALSARDIEIPFPQRDIHIRSMASTAVGLVEGVS